MSEQDINRMARSIIRTTIAMGLYGRAVKDETYVTKFPEHEQIALQTARESIVLLRNVNHVLPLDPKTTKTILLTGEYVDSLARGGGSAAVEGYDQIVMLEALREEFGEKIDYVRAPSDKQLSKADVVLLSIGTHDSEGWDRSFSLPEETDARVLSISEKNPNVVVIVNAGGGVRMTPWNDKVAAILYAWYPGQNGNKALAEILSGKTNPSGKLPITIEKAFDDSPGCRYVPRGEQLYTGWRDDMSRSIPIYNIRYKEGVFVGYRWYESRDIQPLYPFGFGLSYTAFAYTDMTVSEKKVKRGTPLTVKFTVRNSGTVDGAEIAQLYVQDVASSVPRPRKELKGWRKIFLKSGGEARVRITLHERDFSFWDTKSNDWFAEPGEFNILVGGSSNDIRQQARISLE